MKLLHRLLIIFLTVLMFNSLEFSKADELDDFASEMNDIREEINDIRAEISNLKTENLEEVIQLDKSFQELDKIITFVTEKVDERDFDTALSTLEFMDNVMTDVAKSMPKEFESEVVGDAKKEFSKKEMTEITKITQGMGTNKKKKMKKLAEDMNEVKDKGLDTYKIANQINATGIKTINAAELAQALGSVNKRSQLDLEIRDTQKYSLLLGRSAEEVDLSLKQVQVIQSADPKKHRAFDIEKYGKAAGIDQETISKGIEAVYSGNLEVEKNVSYEILSKLEQNPDYVFDLPSMNQMDTMMQQNVAQEKAIDAILNSGINFGKGTNTEDIKALTQKVGEILGDGSVDSESIKRVTYALGRTEFTVWNSTEEVAAAMIAEMVSREQAYALGELKSGFTSSKSLAEQAAQIQATLNNAGDVFVDSKAGDRLVIESLSEAEKSELGKVYQNALEDSSYQISEEVSAFRVPEEFRADPVITPEGETCNYCVDPKYVLDPVITAEGEICNYCVDPKYVLDPDISSSASEAASSATEAATEAAASATEAATEAAQEAASSATEAVTEAAQEVAQEAVGDFRVPEEFRADPVITPEGETCNYCVDPKYTLDPND